MKIALGSDHAGFALKQHLMAFLEAEDHEVLDQGTNSEETTDYPIYCVHTARQVAEGGADRGIVLGGSGQGEQIVANKVPGIRASLCNDLYTARLSRQHNDANVLGIGARIVAATLAEEIVQVWLSTSFDGGRHERRIEQIAAIERGEL
ncbi:MAG: ribose 5-phosphate isomerase B [Actinomycetota bacterium]